MKTKKIEFKGANNVDLVGQLDTPDTGAATGIILFAHCFTCSRNLKSIHAIAKSMTENGWGVFRFDFTGIGDSSGDFSKTTLRTNVDDLRAAARWLEQNHQAPAVLMGHSMGGSAVLLAAPDMPDCKAVITLATPSAPTFLKEAYAGQMDELKEAGYIETTIAGRTFKLNQEFFDELDNQARRQDVQNLQRPLLVIHSENDRLVPIQHAELLLDQAKHPKSLLTFKHVDHLFSDMDFAARLGHLLADWIELYLPRTG